MFIILIALVFSLIIYRFYTLVTKNLDYWKKKNVPYLKPKIFFGNFFEYITLRKNVAFVTSEICEQFPDEPYVGVLYGTEPALIVKDPNLIKLVMSKDFYYFNGREITDYANCEPITRNIFFNAGDQWRVCRQNLTPLFTSAKLKMMFPLIKNCVKEFEEHIANETKMSQTMDLKLLMMKYAMECIMSCVFGFNANMLKNCDDNNPFLIMSKSLFDISFTRGIKMVARSLWPSIFYGLGLRLFEDKNVAFFSHIFHQVSNERASKKSYRNDFIDLISNWKNEAYITGDSIKNLKTNEKKPVRIKANDELLIAQCILFFAAGFETTSSVINFMLYELAKNKTIQDRVIEEIDEYLKKHNGDFEYDIVNELPYAEACLEETLRLYPILGVLTREVWDDYVMPTGLRLEKGDRVHIPVYHLHKNPKYFVDPEVFRPERFLGDERKNIPPFTYLPFGEGPRICIGIRFAKMAIWPGLAALFRDYRIELAENMPTKIDFIPTSIVTHSDVDLQFKIIHRFS